ncbi:hypothetical protein [uncultured Bacteroides sp.]|uniref:hypothetical protein n=1 Tax=uncultured Bacteroides sp. TaxID=162156 RepID=UPI0025D1BE7E|nr:hypothetical protein [uncultured Bacteroides sp.]
MNRLEYIQTLGMTLEETHKWEKENKGVSVEGGNGALLECYIADFYSTDSNGNLNPDSRHDSLSVSLCSDCSDDELRIYMHDKDEIRRLRDYLNNYLENNFKEE